MRRKDLIKQLRKIAKSKGLELELTEGANHTKAKIGDWAEPIPRHNEINEMLAKSILKRSKK